VTGFRCPACGFRVFNRRCANCEACGKPLPEELLLSSEEVARRQSDERGAADRKKKVTVKPVENGAPCSTPLGNLLEIIGRFIT